MSAFRNYIQTNKIIIKLMVLVLSNLGKNENICYILFNFSSFSPYLFIAEYLKVKISAEKELKNLERGITLNNVFALNV